MSNVARRGKLKPWAEDVRWPDENYRQHDPLPDLRLEQFSILIARNVPKCRAVRTAFPNSAISAAPYRAARILNDDGVRARIAFLRRQVAAITAGAGVGDIKIDPDTPTALGSDIDAPIVKSGQDNDNIGHALDNLGHGEDKIPAPVSKVDKRRGPASDDLTPAELRRIISDGARAGMPAAIQAAIKMLDAKLSAPATYADPAAICAVLFNGGGGGESLDVVIDRLAQTYGAQQVIDAMSHNKAYVTYIDNARAKGIKPQDIAQHTDTHGADVGSVDSGGLCAQDDAGETYTDTGSMGEGGEDAGVEGVYGCSENFEAPKYTNRLKPPLRPQDVAGATNDAGPPPH